MVKMQFRETGSYWNGLIIFFSLLSLRQKRDNQHFPGLSVKLVQVAGKKK